MASSSSEFTRQEIVAGFLVITAVAVLIAFFAVIQGFRPRPEVNHYYAHFTKTNGLNVGADVRFGGVKAGFVSAVEPAPKDQSLIRVQVAVAPEFPINTETIATIEQVSLTSDKHLELSTGAPKADRLKEGDTIEAASKSGGIIDMPDLSGVTTRVESLLDDVAAFLGVQEAQQREAAGDEEFAQLARVTADLRRALTEGTGLVTDVREVVTDQQPQIEAILAKVGTIEDTANSLLTDVQDMIAENRPPLNETLTGASDVMGRVDTVVADLSQRLELLLKTLELALNNTEILTGHAKTMVEENRPVLEDTLQDIRQTIRNLKDFSQTLAQQPHAVIRGKTPTGRE